MVKLPSNANSQHEYCVYRNVRIPMRDGVELSANIFFPGADGKVDFEKTYPVILIRTAYAYGNGEFATQPVHLPYYAAELGYVVVLQSSRGTYLSDGELVPMIHEANDGVDTAEWIVKQPWSNGKIATTGHSWLAGTEYLLHMEKNVPGLKTGVIRCPAVNTIDGGWGYDGEFADASCMASWCVSQALDVVHNKHLPQELIDGILSDNEAMGQPLTNPAAMDMTGWQARFSPKDIPIARNFPFYQMWLDNRDNPDHFKWGDVKNVKHDMDRPLLFSGGWHDLFLNNVLGGFERAVKDAPTEEISKQHRLIVGPWGHMCFPFPGMYNYPENADTDDRVYAMEWIDSKLNDKPSEFFDNNPVAIYVMGENRWRSEESWPIKDAEITRWYLHSNGAANTLNGDGLLSTVAPETEENSDSYIADPANPVFAMGGHGLMCGAPGEQSEVETREDVLVYTSEVLSEDMEVTGYIKAKLFAASSANDTDFIMKLLDVSPEGQVYNLCSGGRRARYVKGGRTNPQPIIPGEVIEYEMEMRAISHVFKQGHRIRVEVCSSDPMNKEVGPNNFVDLNTVSAEDRRVATQTIFHDNLRPSCVELPVVPASHEKKWIDKWPFDAKLTGVDIWKSMTMIPGWDVVTTPPTILNSKELPTVGTVISADGADEAVHSAVETIRF